MTMDYYEELSTAEMEEEDLQEELLLLANPDLSDNDKQGLIELFYAEEDEDDEPVYYAREGAR